MLLQTLAYVAAMLFTLSSNPHRQAEGQAELHTAAEVLARMANTYRSCQSYSDTGAQIQVLRGPNGDVVTKVRFTTTFIRPGRFRFEFAEAAWPNYRYLIWRDGREVRTFWDLNSSVRTHGTLDEAVATAAGVTRRASHTVPALLHPDEIGGTHLSRMVGALRLDDEGCDGGPCYVLEGDFRNTRLRVWVDQATFLIRKIVDPPLLGDVAGSIQITTTYHPAIDGYIAAVDLRFDPTSRD